MHEVARTLFSRVLSKSPPGPVKALIPYVIRGIPPLCNGLKQIGEVVLS